MIDTACEIEAFNLLLLIALALVFARILGYLLYKCKQPAVIGEIIAGIILGWIGLVLFTGETISFFGLHITMPCFTYQSSEYAIFAEIGILFLLFISGLEIQFSQLKKMEKASIFVASGGVIVPLIFGIIGGMILQLSLEESIVIGLILIATSVGVTVRTLMDINALDTDVGATILGS